MAPEALWAQLLAAGGRPEPAAGRDIAYDLFTVDSYHRAKFQLNWSTGVRAYSGQTHTHTHTHTDMVIFIYIDLLK